MNLPLHANSTRPLYLHSATMSLLWGIDDVTESYTPHDNILTTSYFTFVPAKRLSIEWVNEATSMKRASCCQSVDVSIIPAWKQRDLNEMAMFAPIRGRAPHSAQMG